MGSPSHSYHLSLEPAFPAGSNSLKWQKGHTLPLWLCSLVCRDAQAMQRRDDALILNHMSQQIVLCIMSSCCMICTALSIQQGSCHAHPYVFQMIYIFIKSLSFLLPSNLDWCQFLITMLTQVINILDFVFFRPVFGWSMGTVMNKRIYLFPFSWNMAPTNPTAVMHHNIWTHSEN